MNMTLTLLVCVAGVIIPGLLALLILGSPLLSMMIAGVALLIEIPCVYLVAVFWPQQRELKRRLTQVAATLKGKPLSDATPSNRDSIFREQRRKSRLVGWLERRFPLVDVRRALPTAVGLGVLGMIAAGVGAVWMGFGPLATLFLLVAGGPGCGWFVLARQDSGQRNEFTKIFPETTDQVVRLVRAGVPPMEAISIVAQEAQPPVGGIMRDVASAVAAGLDPEPAIRNVAARVRIPAFSLFSAAVCLQLTTGGGISGALGNLSATLRARLDLELKATASTAQTRLTLAIISLVPVVVLAAQNFTSPQAIETLFYTESGGTLLRYGVGLILSGLLVARALSARIGR